MNRDDYLKYETRKKIATAFIEKLDNVSLSDVNLLPAINRYIETGNDDYFQEFNDFHFIKTIEQRFARLQNSKELQETIEEVEKRNTEYRNQYDEFCAKYDEWRRGIFKEINKDIDVCENPTIADLRAFIDKMNGLRNISQRKLYIIVDDKLRRVDSLTLTDDNKAIIEVGSYLAAVCPAPSAPKMNFNEMEVIFNGRPRQNSISVRDL